MIEKERLEEVFENLSDLLNQKETGRTMLDDFGYIIDGLSNLKERIDSAENQDVYEEDKINLGWALDFIDYLYKIYKIVYDKNGVNDGNN